LWVGSIRIFLTRLASVTVCESPARLHRTTSVHSLGAKVGLVTFAGSISTPFRQMKPDAQDRLLGDLASVNCVVPPPWIKKAQVPPQIVAFANGVVGRCEILNVVAVGVGLAETVVM